jgi:hypothetical protein
MILSAKKVLEVARNQVLDCEERFVGYRVELVKTLNRVIAAQGDGLSDKQRREKVAKEVEALSQKVAAKMREETP